jgi:tRNA(Ile)-lysidine synthase TilS/MesJ
LIKPLVALKEVINRRLKKEAMVNLASLYKGTGDIPWVLGLSGGKDSTALTMHLLETMEQLPPPFGTKNESTSLA